MSHALTPREIIAEAWNLTRREKSLRRWGVASAFLETLLNVKLVSYQAYFLWSHLRGGRAGFWDIELALFHRVPLWLFLAIIIIFALMVTIELFVPHLALGAIIGLAAKSYRKEPVKGGMVLALYNFFPIFAIHELFVLSSVTMAVTVISLILRYVDNGMHIPLIIGVVVLWGISSILKFTFGFAQEAVVIRRVTVFAALGQSFKLIVSYLNHVMFLVLLLFVISIRILFNLLAVLVIPAVTIGIGFLAATFLSQTLSIIIAVTVGMAMILVASYFFGHLHVFKEAVWTITYIELSKRKELDVIEE